MAAVEGKQTVNLKSSDKREFVVDLAAAQMSVTIKNMLEGGRAAPPGLP
jgi:hypothetical protein